MNISERQNVVGYFGKVPVRGDYVTQHLPSEFVEPWDDWINEVLLHAKGQLGEKWLEHYLISPIWRFALSGGICGKATWKGVMMPSVDAVGRYFPMTIAASRVEIENPLQSLLMSDDWYERAEEAVRSCLDDELSFEELEESLKGLSRVEKESNNADEFSRSEEFSGAWVVEAPTLDSLAMKCPELVDRMLRELFFAYSVWWTQGSKHVKPVFLACQGLPPIEGFSAMLDGNWQEWGWQSWQVVEMPVNGNRHDTGDA